MSKSAGKKPKEKSDKSKADNFVWSDDEVQLPLEVTNDYKVSKAAKNIDWDSCQSKYTDILELYREHYPSSQEESAEIEKEYPHKKEEITKAILTSKLKNIRLKFRQAIDSGKRSGHGRVVLLYFEICESIWGGSPATSTILSGIETGEVKGGCDSIKTIPIHLNHQKAKIWIQVKQMTFLHLIVHLILHLLSAQVNLKQQMKEEIFLMQS